jgi:2-alkyl-3-oxoalkanoate reductase
VDKMRVFVTGATGALGRWAVPLLVEQGHDVTAVGRTPAKRGALERMGARPVEVDLFDAAAVRRAIGRAEGIVNLATAVPPGFRSFLPWAWRPMDRIRRQVSANLVAAALAGDSVQRLVQESFAPVYADAGDAWVDESWPFRPDWYNRSVLDAERQADTLTRAGWAGVVLRFGLLYGPADDNSLMLIDAIRRGWYPLLGSPDGYSSWVTHEDAAAAVAAALTVPAGVYNVVDDQPLRRRELAGGIARLVGVGPPRFLPAWAATLGGPVVRTIARSLRISNRKLRQASTWEPKYRTPLEGFARVIAARAAQGRVREVAEKGT